MIRYYLFEPGSSTPLPDPDGVLEQLFNVSWKSMWPKGYGEFSATLHQDLFAPSIIKTGRRIVARDGLRTVYDGRLAAPKKSLSNGMT